MQPTTLPFKDDYGFLNISEELDALVKVGHTVSNAADADFKIKDDKLAVVAVVANDEAKRIQQLERHTEHLQSQILNVSPDKKNYYTSKAALALNSLSNTELLFQFEDEAKSKGLTAEQLRDIVLAKANEAYTAFGDIESKLKQALSNLSNAKTAKAKDKVVSGFINPNKQE